MKALLMFAASFISFSCLSQEYPSQKKMNGTWEFLPYEDSGDTTFLAYCLFKKNKSVHITYWREAEKVSIYGFPFSYYGFWDNNTKDPVRITDLATSGENIRFYDHIGESYDSLGNLLQQTRGFWMSYNEEEEPNHEPALLRFYFGRGTTPDIYKRVKELPRFIIQSLREHRNEWHKFELFMEMKPIRVAKAFIYIVPRKASKIYLIKGDKVEVLEDKKEWYKIRYYGAKITEGWIKKSDVEEP